MIDIPFIGGIDFKQTMLESQASMMLGIAHALGVDATDALGIEKNTKYFVDKLGSLKNYMSIWIDDQVDRLHQYQRITEIFEQTEMLLWHQQPRKLLSFKAEFEWNQAMEYVIDAWERYKPEMI